jgi:hypothetical protein
MSADTSPLPPPLTAAARPCVCAGACVAYFSLLMLCVGAAVARMPTRHRAKVRLLGVARGGVDFTVFTLRSFQVIAQVRGAMWARHGCRVVP